MRGKIVAVAVAVLLSFAGRSAWGQVQYTVTDLGPGAANGINDSGQVAGCPVVMPSFTAVGDD